MGTPLSLRVRLAFAVAASIVPAALLAAALVGYDYYARERARVIRDTTGTARALVAVVDGELQSVRSALSALATSPHLASGNLAAFHAQATTALKDQAMVNVILTDAGGRQLLNTFRPFGAALPSQGDPGGLLRVFQTRAAVVSDLFTGRLTQRPILGIGVPVVVGGGVRYGLNGGVSPEVLSEVLARQQLPQGWVVAIFDTQGTVVARTHRPESFVGQKGASALLAKMKQAGEGWVETDTLEGTPVISVFSRSPESGWTVAIGIPEQELLRHLLFSMARLAIVAFVMLALALAIALAIGNRLTATERG